MRWLFFVMLFANLIPPLFATNHNEQAEIGAAAGDDSTAVRAIQLVSEAGLQPSDGAVTPPRGCLVVGPLGSMAHAERLNAIVNSHGGSAQRRAREVESGTDYWVYIEPQPSARATTRLLQELQASRFESFVVPEGELEGAISVGIFSVQSKAEEQHKQLRDLGFIANIREMQRLAREYWLLVEWSSSMDGGDNLEDVLEPEADIQKNPSASCKTVASDRRFP